MFMLSRTPRRPTALLQSCRHVAARAAVALMALAPFAMAQGAYPDKPIRLVVPFPAGESLDVVARMVAERWSKLINQPIIIDNRPGAGGAIGAEYVAKAAPDGYTLLMANVSALAINPVINKNTRYDAEKDFAAVTQISNVPLLLFVSAAVPFKTVDELVAFARKNPGRINFASTGIASGPHLAGEQFKALAGIDLVHVPYKGVSLALPDILAGQVQMVFYPVTFVDLVNDGKLRALMTPTEQRSPTLPDIPTAAEAGMPSFRASSWHAVMAPAGTPPDYLALHAKAISDVLKDPEVRERMHKIGAYPVGGTPEEMARFLAAEVASVREIAKRANITVN